MWSQAGLEPIFQSWTNFLGKCWTLLLLDTCCLGMQLGGAGMGEGCLGSVSIAEGLEVPCLAYQSIPIKGLPSSTPWRFNVPSVPLAFTGCFFLFLLVQQWWYWKAHKIQLPPLFNKLFFFSNCSVSNNITCCWSCFAFVFLLCGIALPFAWYIS